MLDAPLANPSTHTSHTWRRMTWWRSLAALLSLSAVTMVLSNTAQAQTAYPPLELKVKTTTRYQMRANPRTGEVMVRILGGDPSIPEQVARWNHPLLSGAVAVPRGSSEIVIRMRMRWRVTVYGALRSSPPRLILGLGEPIQGGGAVYARTAVDFMAPQGVKPPPRKASTEPTTVEGRARNALLLPDLPPDEGPPPEYSLAMGNRSLYNIPHPPFPSPFDRWKTNYSMPSAFDASTPPEVKELWTLARAGKLEASLVQGDDLLRDQKYQPWRVEIIYLQAALCYELADHPNMPELTPVERARLAFGLDSDHPLANQTLYMNAVGYMRLGFFHEASRQLLDLHLELPDSHPHARDVLFALGRADHQRGKPEQAIESYLQILDQVTESRRDDVLLAMAGAELDAGNGRSSLLLLGLATELDASWKTTRYYKHVWAEALYRTNRFKQARQAFATLLDEERGTEFEPWLQLRLAECLLMQEDFQASANFFIRDINVKQLDPLNRTLVTTLWKLRSVQLRMMRQDTRLAQPMVSLLERLRLEVPLSPVEPEVLFELGKYHHRANDIQSAVPYFSELFERYPDFPFRKTAIALVWQGFKERIEARHADGDDFEAVALYEQFLPILDAESAGEAHIFFLVAHCYIRLGLYEGAYAALAPAFFLADVDPEERSQAALMTAVLQRLRGYPDAALPAVDLIRRRSQDDELRIRADFEEALVRQELGEELLAIQLFERFANEGEGLPEVPSARLAQGQIYLARGDSKAAADALMAAVEAADALLPPPVEEEEGEGDEEENEEGDEDGAGERIAPRPTPTPLYTPVDSWETWYLPTQDDIRDARAEALYLLGDSAMSHADYTTAVQAFERALKVRPAHPSSAYAQYTLGRALFAAGKEEKAYERWQTLAENTELADSPWVPLATQMLEQMRWENEALGGPIPTSTP